MHGQKNFKLPCLLLHRWANRHLQKIQCPYLKGQIVQEDLLLFFDCFALTREELRYFESSITIYQLIWINAPDPLGSRQNPKMSQCYIHVYII
jgi:hypothetical protein